MLVLKTVLQGNLRKDNGDFYMKDDYITTYIKTDDLKEITDKIMAEIIDTVYNEFDLLSYLNIDELPDTYENLYPDFYIYKIENDLWEACEKLNIIPEIKNEWMIGCISISEMIENEEGFDKENIYKKLFTFQLLNNLLSENKIIEDCDHLKLI